jgi:hypothetical protein
MELYLSDFKPGLVLSYRLGGAEGKVRKLEREDDLGIDIRLSID